MEPFKHKGSILSPTDQSDRRSCQGITLFPLTRTVVETEGPARLPPCYPRGAPMVRMRVAICCASPRQVPRHNTSPLTRRP
eukprot:3221453-Heterocapsa_arctica.AAC.1